MPPQRRQSWQDVADVQADLVQWVKAKAGQAWLMAGFMENAKSLEAGTREMLQSIYATEGERIASADPIFVSAEMCDVVDAAISVEGEHRFQAEALLPKDLMTSHGFILYERPFEVPDRFDEPVSIHGFSWMPMLNPELAERVVEQINREAPNDKRGGSEIMLRALRGLDDYGKLDLDHPTGGPAVNGITLTIYATTTDAHKRAYNTPLVAPMHFTPWWFGMSFDGNEVDENGEATGAEWWWKVLQTTLRLMQQRLAASHRYRPDRAGRRNLRAAGLPDDRDVVVVRLRREQTPGQEGGPHEEANYSHRFIVGGHWRQQPYPSEGVVRQIWIHAYEKGPEGAPLIIRPNRAFTWTR